MSFPISDLVFPEGSTEGPFLEQLVSEHTSQIIGRFVARRGGDACDPNLLGILAEKADALDFDTAWNPSFGGIHAEALRDGGRAVEKLACVGLRLHEAGCEADWSADISEQVGLRFDRWSLPPCDRIAVQGSPATVCITTRGSDGPRELRFARGDDGWVCESRGVSCLPEARMDDSRVIVLGRRELWSEEVADIVDNLDDAAPYLMATRAGRALRVLQRLAPAYYRWVTRVVRYIAPWRVESRHRPSGSSSSNLAPGLVGIGNHDHAASLAESLVHEASHHYFYCAMRLGAVDDGTDTKLYDNPFFGKDRPIGRILLAYHAFVNVRRYCRAALSAGEGDLDYFEPREQEVTRGLAIMEDALLGNPALTPLGKLLWQRLYEGAHDE